MKKCFASLLVVLMLAGCSDAYAKISNPNDTIFTVAGSSFTRGELYNYMTSSDSGYTAINMSMEHILTSKVETTDEMTKNVEETVAMYSSLLGESFETYIMSMGFANVDAFKESLLLNEKAIVLTEQYISDNFDTLMGTYTPRKVSIASFKDHTLAGKAQAALVDGGDFAEVCETYESTSTSTEPTILTTKSAYPTNVIYTVSTLTDGQVSEVIASDDQATFYVVVMNAANPADFKDEAIDAVASIDTISSEAMLKAFEAADFKVFDKNMFDAISTSYPEYLNQ